MHVRVHSEVQGTVTKRSTICKPPEASQSVLRISEAQPVHWSFSSGFYELTQVSMLELANKTVIAAQSCSLFLGVNVNPPGDKIAIKNYLHAPRPNVSRPADQCSSTRSNLCTDRVFTESNHLIDESIMISARLLCPTAPVVDNCQRLQNATAIHGVRRAPHTCTQLHQHSRSLRQQRSRCLVIRASVGPSEQLTCSAAV